MSKIDERAENRAWAEKQVADWPPLTDRQRVALAELLKPVRVTASGERRDDAA